MYCYVALTSSIVIVWTTNTNEYAMSVAKEEKDNTISKRQHKCYHNIYETENSGESQPNPKSR
jgi:competence protein ComGC